MVVVTKQFAIRCLSTHFGTQNGRKTPTILVMETFAVRYGFQRMSKLRSYFKDIFLNAEYENRDNRGT